MIPPHDCARRGAHEPPVSQSSPMESLGSSGRADVGRAASRQADLTRMRCERVACKRAEVAEAGTGALRAHVRHAAITHLTAARTAGSRGGTESGRAVAHPGRDGGRRREETAKV